MFYYTPSTQLAYRSMKDLEYVVSFGVVLRNMHRWSAHAMVAVAFLHMCRVFYTGSYKAPREFNWVIGVCLLLVTLFLSFTGYLLPWDQLAFWAVTVGSNIVAYMPWLGEKVRFLLLGGQRGRSDGAPALLRASRRGACRWPRSSCSGFTSGESARTAGCRARRATSPARRARAEEDDTCKPRQKRKSSQEIPTRPTP